MIMRNDDSIIGLFQCMFDKNMLTFNRLGNNAEEVDPFKDVRVLQEELRAKGIEFIAKVGVESDGPGSFIIDDPDGNPILVDQHL